VREALNLKKEKSHKDAADGLPNTRVLGDVNDDDDDDEDDFSFDARMRQQILKKRMEMGDLPAKPKSQTGTIIFIS